MRCVFRSYRGWSAERDGMDATQPGQPQRFGVETALPGGRPQNQDGFTGVWHPQPSAGAPRQWDNRGDRGQIGNTIQNFMQGGR